MKNLRHKIQRGLTNYWSLYARQKTPIAIFCTGRVGSMSLFFTLEELGLFTFKIERLANAELRRHYGNSEWFYKHILQAGRATKIVSIARDPIALMVSDFFNKLNWISGKEEAWKSNSLAELSQLFNETYFEQARHIAHLEWWNQEFKAALGLDVYQHASPRDTGWVRFQEAQFDVLLIRTELDNKTKSAALGAFVNQQDLQIKRVNVGDEKIFGDAYKQFKEELSVDAKHLDTVYNSAYARHFFSDEEIKSFRAKWSKVPV
jgi:hypothetical protein